MPIDPSIHFIWRSSKVERNKNNERKMYFLSPHYTHAHELVGPFTKIVKGILSDICKNWSLIKFTLRIVTKFIIICMKYPESKLANSTEFTVPSPKKETQKSERFYCFEMTSNAIFWWNSTWAKIPNMEKQFHEIKNERKKKRKNRMQWRTWTMNDTAYSECWIHQYETGNWNEILWTFFVPT